MRLRRAITDVAVIETGFPPPTFIRLDPENPDVRGDDSGPVGDRAIVSATRELIGLPPTRITDVALGRPRCLVIKKVFVLLIPAGRDFARPG